MNTGSYSAEDYAKSHLCCSSRAEVRKFPLAYVIFFSCINFRQYFVCLHKRIFNCCKKLTVRGYEYLSGQLSVSRMCLFLLLCNAMNSGTMLLQDICLSVRHTLVLCRNDLSYRQIFFTVG